MDGGDLQIESLLQVIDPPLAAADDRQVHVALQRLVVGDDDAMELRETSVLHDHTDNDSEESASTSTRATANQRIASTSDPKKRKRRFTYIVRKEEKSELLKEIEELQERVRELDAPRTSAQASLAASKQENALLRETARSQQLSLASAQCVVSGILNCKESNPLSTTRIRLGTDWDERRRTLLEMKPQAIRHACEYVEARSRFLDPLQRHVSEERFESASGDFFCARYDIYQFTNVTSVKEVYDALLAYFHSIEISVSERLGDITTRDDFDLVENSISSFRFLTTVFGVPTEKQGVLFMEYFDSHELFGGEPCGVVAVDRVEEDELFPYKPEERFRKDISTAIVLTPHWRECAQGEKELVVSMSMGKFKKLHRPQCSLATPEAMEQMRESAMGWGSVMIAAIRDFLDRMPM
ncbi:hypothetical protein Gpo141_00004018 [Globisporangium polare]